MKSVDIQGGFWRCEKKCVTLGYESEFQQTSV